MISILVYLLVLVLILGVVWWAIGALGIPEPMNRFARVLVVIIALVFTIYLLLSMTGEAPQIHLR